jgi:hypothetical protein
MHQPPNIIRHIFAFKEKNQQLRYMTHNQGLHQEHIIMQNQPEMSRRPALVHFFIATDWVVNFTM